MVYKSIETDKNAVANFDKNVGGLQKNIMLVIKI